MMKLRLVLIGVTIVSGIACAFADECKVSTSEELIQKITEIKENGACLTDNAKYRKGYEDFRGSSIEFHVLHFTKSIQIETPFSCLEGFQKRPLIILADADLLVTIESLQSSCIDGKGGSVIMDNLHFKNGGIEILSSGNAIINSEFRGGGIKIAGNSNHIVKSDISENADDGIEVSGKENKIIETNVHENSGNGIHIKGEGAKVYKSRIYQNAKNGIYVNQPVFITKTEFSKNGLDGITFEKEEYPSPLNLVSIGTPTEWKVTGDFLIPDGGPWNNINYQALKIELFLHNGPFVAESDDFVMSEKNPKLLSFVFTIPRPVSIDGEEYQTPTFVATAVDYENFITSPLSIPMNATTQNDWDNDGIPNEQEDYNHNGLVDYGETDSRNSDTDGDGLSDGEERLHINRVSELIEKGVVFNDLAKLDPTNPDSDGDCIMDGTELGFDGVTAVSAIKALFTSSDKDFEKLSPSCREILKKHGGVAETTGTATITDPTNSDSDDDGLRDGEEDWNFNGKKDSNKDGPVETDPSKPDSDGDTILDGAEGDKNNNGKLDENETDYLKKDTDGDGSTDDIEIGRYGSLPNSCDTDKDGLSDGIETGAINPDPENSFCRGLQIAGTNFAAIGILSPISADSDADGLNDGEEDANANGWLDLNETDPTTSDTDGDGLFDRSESILDTDNDGIPDVDFTTFKGDDKCTPPKSAVPTLPTGQAGGRQADDLDCDGIINARDDDSDSDGCFDRDEISQDKDKNGIPDVWENGQASCNVQNAPVSNGGVGSTPSAAAAAPEEEAKVTLKPWEKSFGGGGACSLVRSESRGAQTENFIYLIALLPLIFIYKRRSLFVIPAKAGIQ
jgi:hypothetical protein